MEQLSPIEALCRAAAAELGAGPDYLGPVARAFGIAPSALARYMSGEDPGLAEVHSWLSSWESGGRRPIRLVLTGARVSAGLSGTWKTRMPLRLLPAQVAQLRSDYAGGASQEDLATKYATSIHTIGKALRGDGGYADPAYGAAPGTRRTGRQSALTEAQVAEVQALHATGATMGSVVATFAERFGVHRVTIRRALRRGHPDDE